MARTVVLSDAEDVEPRRLGERGLLDEQPYRLGVVEDTAVVRRDLSEGVDSDIEGRGAHDLSSAGSTAGVVIDTASINQYD
ncbi:hypothetical protein [Streptomyces sp. NRRL F-3307]|uniref:hypothetical protein n=1 Tax=Streptomyces sp. NRRL F-3307 TaxID=1463849 RepID=UPI000690FAAF|nr:hypothetical protein [Streptomyces sp. NRRL F-3307]